MKKNVLFLCATLASSASCLAAEYEVIQEKKMFDIKEMTIKVGDSVSFKNNDPFFHNVFSLSDAKFFDLGSYEKGQAKSVVFDETGVVEIECAIHPSMQMKITVE